MQFNYSPCRESGTRTRIPVAPDHVGFQLPHFSFSVSAPSGLAITGSRTSENCTSFPQRVFSTTNVSFLRSEYSSYAKGKQSARVMEEIRTPMFPFGFLIHSQVGRLYRLPPPCKNSKRCSIRKSFSVRAGIRKVLQPCSKRILSRFSSCAFRFS